jgi:hypothetical protein
MKTKDNLKTKLSSTKILDLASKPQIHCRLHGSPGLLLLPPPFSAPHLPQALALAFRCSPRSPSSSPGRPPLRNRHIWIPPRRRQLPRRRPPPRRGGTLTARSCAGSRRWRSTSPRRTGGTASTASPRPSREPFSGHRLSLCSFPSRGYGPSGSH